MNPDLETLYEAVSDGVLYGIGLTQATGDGREEPPTPTIAIVYPHWTRQQLELVRGAFGDGLTLKVNDADGGACCIYLATRQRVAVGLQGDGETDVLRGPAWDARLEGVERQALAMFQRGRQSLGGFLLFLQTSHWEFVTGVDERKDAATVGAIVPRTAVIPPTSPSDRHP